MRISRIMNREFFGFTALEISLFFAVFTLPFSNNLNSRAVIVFCLLALFANGLKDKTERLTKNRMWIWPVLLFFIFLASLLWDPNGIHALKAMEKRMSLLALPLLLASLPTFRPKVVKVVFLSFLISIAVVCFCCLVKAEATYTASHDYREFFYQFLSSEMKLNAIYLSWYCAFCLCILLHYYFFNPSPFRFIPTAVAIILYLYFSAFIILLSSKMIIFLFIALTLLSVIYLFYINGKLIAGLLLFLSFLLVSGIVIWNTPYLKWRIEVTSLKKYGGQTDDQNGLAVRQKLWETATRLIEKKPLLGYGVENADQRLVEEYKKSDFQIAAENRYNSHSTYLQTVLNAGLLALIPLLCFLYFSIVTAVRRKNFLFFSFLLLLIPLSVTEAVLEGQKGVVFLTLFILLFIYHSSPDLNNTLRKKDRAPG
jgi:O-antigen ligase